MNSFCATPDYMIEVASRNHDMPSMHYHASYELYYLCVGSRDYFIEDKLFQVSAGDFVLIPPGKLHRTGGEYGERILIDFKTDFLSKVYTQETIGQLVKCFDHWKRTPSVSQQKTCTDLLKKLQESKSDMESALLLGMLLLELEACTNQEIQEDPVSPIVAFINTEYAKISSISEIADQFFISKYHLCRIFKNAMKITVVDYLNQIRIKNACQFLRFTKKSIWEIALACGYRSAAYFSSVFKQTMGCSPSQYRQESKK